MSFADDIVNQPLRRGGQHQTAGPADDHQQESEAEYPPPRSNQFPDIGPKFAKPFGRAFLGFLRSHELLNYCIGCGTRGVGFEGNRCARPSGRVTSEPRPKGAVADALSMPTLYAGTSGFAYPSWKPDFYPAKMPSKKFLSYYSERLNAVEVPYTFRRLPSPSP